MSIILENPHFYTPFSIGLFLISLHIYNSSAKEPLFYKWSICKHFSFWILLIIACFIVDETGLFLGYWYYPHYFVLSDNIIKILFEYAVPFADFMIIVFIGKNILKKKKNSAVLSFLLSLLILAPMVLVFTEYINSFSTSWIFVMPKLLWYTAGSWFMAIIPIGIYYFVD